MIREISIEETRNLEDAKYIDVRAPIEFEKGHIPGAINIPLLFDEERSEIGTIYRTVGSEGARARGLELVSPRLSALMEEMREMAKSNSLIVYCWRGGDRSRSVTGLMEIIGIEGYRLKGGYKSYRQYVIDRLGHLPSKKVAVIHGLTGTGKTDIIKEAGIMGWPVLDLEELANHRGSVFGGLGLGNQPSQKQFESIVLDVIESFADQKGLILESESKKIGRLYVPDHLFRMMTEGWHVLIYDSIENRIKRLYQEYIIDHHCEVWELENAAKGIGYFLGKKASAEIAELIKLGELSEAIRRLLVEYYDPLYGYPSHPDSGYDLCLDGGDSVGAAKKLISWLKTA